jgi:hypothetical protein
MFKPIGRHGVVSIVGGAMLVIGLATGAWANPKPPPPPPPNHKAPPQQAPEIDLAMLGIEILIASAGVTVLVLNRRQGLRKTS